MKIHSIIQKDGTIPLSENQQAFFQKNAGKRVNIEIDERSTLEKQRFIEGAIVKYWFYQHMPGVFENFEQARDSLKTGVHHVTWTYDHHGKKITKLRSMSEVYANNRKAADFIDKCNRLFMEQGYEFPDPDAFKEWEASGPPPGAVYPPLIDLMARYKQEVDNRFPWRKKV